MMDELLTSPHPINLSASKSFAARLTATRHALFGDDDDLDATALLALHASPPRPATIPRLFTRPSPSADV